MKMKLWHNLSSNSMYVASGSFLSVYAGQAIRQLIATIDHLVCFETEEYEKLAKRIAQHASKLVVVDFQSRATVLAAHLFMSGQGGSAGVRAYGLVPPIF